MFEKRYEQKKCPKYFEIREYAFLNILKGYEQKNGSKYFEIRKYTFFKYLKKGMSKKNVPSILRFVSMLFNVIIFLV